MPPGSHFEDPRFQQYAAQAVLRMRGHVDAFRARKIGLGGPVAETQVQALEKALRVPLPPDYRTFLLATGGPSPGSNWLGLWRIEEIASLNTNLPVFQWFGGLIGIGNEGFIVTAFDYRRGPLPTVVSLGMSSSDWEDVTQEARTFEEWLTGRA